MCQIIPFPSAALTTHIPSFVDWMNVQFPGKKWVVVKTRKFGGRFGLSPDRHALLLQREYSAMQAQYERQFGRSANAI